MTELPKFVQQRLKAATCEGTHLDPSLLTGFIEHALPPRLRAQVVEHLGGCSECRLLVSLAKPEVPEAQVVFQPRGWQRWSVLRWASGVATVAVVAGSLFVVRTEWMAKKPNQTPTVQRPLVAAIADQSAATAGSPVPQSSEPKREETVAAARSEERPVRQDSRIPDSRPTIETSTDVNRMLTVGDRGNLNTALGVHSSPPAAASIESGPKILWRIAGRGVVFESFDGGQRWQSVAIRDGIVFRAVTAMGSTVWAGGDDGALYRSPDNGAHWTRVPLFGDSQAFVSDSIRKIQFSDPLHGEISTSFGHSWFTSDGGQTWHRR